MRIPQFETLFKGNFLPAMMARDVLTRFTTLARHPIDGIRPDCDLLVYEATVAVEPPDQRMSLILSFRRDLALYEEGEYAGRHEFSLEAIGPAGGGTERLATEVIMGAAHPDGVRGQILGRDAWLASIEASPAFVVAASFAEPLRIGVRVDRG